MSTANRTLAAVPLHILATVLANAEPYHHTYSTCYITTTDSHISPFLFLSLSLALHPVQGGLTR